MFEESLDNIYIVLPKDLSNNHQMHDEILSFRLLFTDELADKIREIDFLKSKDEAINYWVKIIFEIIYIIQKNWHYHNDSDPGHWLWHFLRDILHAWVILWNIDEKSTEITPNEIFISIISWALHDVWCIFVDRYADANSLNRHAEIWWVIIWKILKNSNLPIEIINAIVWGIMAHSNLRNDTNKKDFINYVYKDELDAWKSINFVNITRQVDRLDTNWLLFICRHILTRYRKITDYSTDWYITQDFYSHLQLNNEPWTMLEHFKMFLHSNEEISWIYNKHDIETMIEKRDKYSKELRNFILSLEKNDENNLIKDTEIENSLNWFLDFLNTYVEPKIYNSNKWDYIEKLRKEFLKLDILTRKKWLTELIKIPKYYEKYLEELINENNVTKMISSLIFPWSNKTIYELLYKKDYK